MNTLVNTSKITGKELILLKSHTLPSICGVYRMIDKDNKVLYVGKAKNLKHRVTSYAQSNEHNNRIATMVQLTHNMEFIYTKTEVDALLLETNLIKKFKPRFNILMRDDKSLPYILLAYDHEIPRLDKHRGKQIREGDYFGPFASVTTVNKTLNILQRAFLLRSCSDNVYKNRTRPCLLHQIKRCSAPCTQEISSTDYNKLVQQAHNFLSGKTSNIQQKLTKEMQAASHRQNYEYALEIRDRIYALNQIHASTDIFSNTIKEADIIAIDQKNGQNCIQIFFFRANTNLGNKAYYFKYKKEVTMEEVLESFIMQFYEQHHTPQHILTHLSLPNTQILSEALSLKKEKKIIIRHPKGEEEEKIVTHVLKNAQEALNRKRLEQSTQKKQFVEMARIFSLKSIPNKIEVFDNSHLMGTHRTGAMIVADQNGFLYEQYRRFNFTNKKANPNDDYAMMKEALTKRYKLSKNTSQNKIIDLPDLIIVDGGLGHFNVAYGVISNLKLDIPIIGIAKGKKRHAMKEKFFTYNRKPFYLPQNSPTLYYLQRLRDEAHRFAITGHRKKKNKNEYKTRLDHIPMIGTKRKQALLCHFGSTQNIMQASLAELKKINGINDKIAVQIYNYISDGRKSF